MLIAPAWSSRWPRFGERVLPPTPLLSSASFSHSTMGASVTARVDAAVAVTGEASPLVDCDGSVLVLARVLGPSTPARPPAPLAREPSPAILAARRRAPRRGTVLPPSPARRHVPAPLDSVAAPLGFACGQLSPAPAGPCPAMPAFVPRYPADEAFAPPPAMPAFVPRYLADEAPAPAPAGLCPGAATLSLSPFAGNVSWGLNPESFKRGRKRLTAAQLAELVSQDDESLSGLPRRPPLGRTWGPVVLLWRPSCRAIWQRRPPRRPPLGRAPGRPRCRSPPLCGQRRVGSRPSSADARGPRPRSSPSCSPRRSDRLLRRSIPPAGHPRQPPLGRVD